MEHAPKETATSGAERQSQLPTSHRRLFQRQLLQLRDMLPDVG